jgi:hypothetical protein
MRPAKPGGKRPWYRRKLILIPAGVIIALWVLGTLVPGSHPAPAPVPVPAASTGAATHAPATHAPATHAPATHAPASTAPAPAAPARVYRAGEFCSSAGGSAIDSHGGPLVCEYKGGYLRWEH